MITKTFNVQLNNLDFDNLIIKTAKLVGKIEEMNKKIEQNLVVSMFNNKTLKNGQNAVEIAISISADKIESIKDCLKMVIQLFSSFQATNKVQIKVKEEK